MDSSHSPPAFPSASEPARAAQSVLTPWLWGGLLTVAFYCAVPFLPVGGELAARYLCGHPLEYVSTTFFLVGIAVLARKALRLPREKAALHAVLSKEEIAGGEKLQETLAAIPSRLHDTAIVRRLMEAAVYLRRRGSAEGMDKHLSHMADLSADELHESYALVRTVTWAVPILGFLGTVMGITLAIANVSPEQLTSSLTEVTGGLGIAFDTTAVALALSLVLVFAAYAVEQSERQVLARVEEFSVKRLACLAPAAQHAATPLGEAERRAAEQLIRQTESLVTRQTQMWQDSLEALRGRWTDTLAEQQDRLESALQGGFGATLADHAAQLQQVRGDFLQAFQHAAASIATQVNDAEQRTEVRQAEHARQLTKLWEEVQAELAATREEQGRQSAELIATLGISVAEWQAQLGESTHAATRQLGELRGLGDTLLRIVAQEEELARLQERLTQNLEAVRAVETFDETIHSLSAAIHLLTARSKPKAA